MPKCECSHCLNLTNGEGKILHRITVACHMEKERMAQSLENEYQSLHSDENHYFEEENLYEENLYEENERSFMEICDNEEQSETNDDLSFQNEENENTNDHYENDPYYENDDLIYDSINESESDDVNSNTDDEGEFQNELESDDINSNTNNEGKFQNNNII